jgi:hypothetical protein
LRVGPVPVIEIEPSSLQAFNAFADLTVHEVELVDSTLMVVALLAGQEKVPPEPRGNERDPVGSAAGQPGGSEAGRAHCRDDQHEGGKNAG